MELTVEKLGLHFKFPSRHHPNSNTSLHNFRTKISDFINKNVLLISPDPGSESLSLTGFLKCFELINITDRAFAKLVAEIDYPMSRWGKRATDEYLSYSLSLLDVLNLINSSVSHLSHAKISISHALTLIKNSPSSAAKNLKKVPIRNLDRKNLKFGGLISGIEERPCPEKESVVLQALVISKKIGFLALGFVLSGLCGDGELYMETRTSFAGRFEDPLVKGLDSGFCRRIRGKQGIVEEVTEVNCATERLCKTIVSGGKCGEAVGELKARLEVLESSIQGVEKRANDMFSQVLATRNKLLDNHRMMGQNICKK